MRPGFRFGAALLALLIATSAPAQPDAGEAARAAINTLDMRRLRDDRAYAETISRHLETLEAEEGEGEHSTELASVRLIVLAGLGRPAEARAAIDHIVHEAPTEVQLYVGAWWSALLLADDARAVTVLETASRRIRGVDWAEMRRQVPRQTLRALFMGLRQDSDRATRVRLAGALLAIGWPGDLDRVAGDDLRKMLLDDRMAQGDLRGAADVAATIRTPAVLLPLLMLRRYDAVMGADSDRLALFRAALAAEERETADALAVREPGIKQRLARSRYLRAVGRNAEAWALAEPATRDVAATVAADENGLWLVDEGAHALDALGRKDEALVLAGRLAAVPVSVNSELINIYINHIDFLRAAGRHAESLAYGRLVERDHGAQASSYGRMWISASIACALAELGRADEAAPVRAAMRATGEDNRAAMIQATLCLGDSAAAETLMIARLEEPDPASVALNFQLLELDDDAPGQSLLATRMRALRERPAVRAAFDRVARRLRLPLAAYTWN